MLQPMALALVHYPVLDRRGDIVTSAVTNLDIHDLARLVTTYGLSRYYLVTPALEQRTLVSRITDHWREGAGATYNPDRCRALDALQVTDSLDQALADWRQLAGPDALPILSGARHQNGLEYAEARELASVQPLMLVLGTGHGLADKLYQHGWPQLAALRAGRYNHLSVRTAAAIMLDRLVGESGQIAEFFR